jgi:hypothetical protein
VAVRSLIAIEQASDVEETSMRTLTDRLKRVEAIVRPAPERVAPLIIYCVERWPRRRSNS